MQSQQTSQKNLPASSNPFSQQEQDTLGGLLPPHFMQNQASPFAGMQSQAGMMAGLFDMNAFYNPMMQPINFYQEALFEDFKQIPVEAIVEDLDTYLFEQNQCKMLQERLDVEMAEKNAGLYRATFGPVLA